MGCDIHILVERKVGNVWEAVKPAPNRTKRQKHNEWVWNFNRCYDVFGIMANIRNGSGFAGCDTGDGFVPISDPKGIPEDASFIARQQENGQGPWWWDHSPSWLTLSEIEEYDWDRTTKRRGWIGVKGYEEWKKQGGGEPQGGWCGGVSGGQVLNLSTLEMDVYLASGRKDGYDRYTQVEWEVSYRDAGANLLDLVAEIRELDLGSGENVRLVFGFDS